MRYAGFFVLLFTVGKNLSFFTTADDINDSDLSIFKGGVEIIGDEFLIIDGVEDNVDVVISTVNINDGLEASIFVISRFGDMFEFIDAFMIFCNLPSVFVDGVRGMFSFDDDDGDGDNDGVSGGELWSQKNR